MFSRFFGKSDKANESPTQEAAKPTRGIEVIEDDPDTAWGMWDSAVAEQQAAPTPPTNHAAAPKPVVPTSRVVAPAAVTAKTPQAAQQNADLPVSMAASKPIENMTLEQRKNMALDVVELHHKRIGNTIRTLWGYKECSIYINKLIMSGGDGMGHARVGFNQEAVQAMLALSDLHDAEFGPPDTIPGGLGLSI